MKKKGNERIFIRKIRMAYRQTQRMIGDKNIRQAQVTNLLATSVGYYLYKSDHKKAVGILLQTVSSLQPGLIINEAMGQSN